MKIKFQNNSIFIDFKNQFFFWIQHLYNTKNVHGCLGVEEENKNGEAVMIGWQITPKRAFIPLMSLSYA